LKNQGLNLGALESALCCVVSCELLNLSKPHARSCFGHLMSKCCQYARSKDKMCINITDVLLKDIQTTLQKTITWTKNFGKQKHDDIEVHLHAQKLKMLVKTHFISKIIVFLKTLKCINMMNIWVKTQLPVQFELS
jgi:hypothetical protein